MRQVGVVEELEGVRGELAALQSDAGLGKWNETLLVDLRLAGIVEAWAAGATWAQVRGRGAQQARLQCSAVQSTAHSPLHTPTRCSSGWPARSRSCMPGW